MVVFDDFLPTSCRFRPLSSHCHVFIPDYDQAIFRASHPHILVPKISDKPETSISDTSCCGENDDRDLATLRGLDALDSDPLESSLSMQNSDRIRRSSA
jgi:hypothetical protein